MKVLWVCNIVLPDFSGEFGFRKNNFGGWITGMLNHLEEKVDISLCFPIYDHARMRDGYACGHRYYSFPSYGSEYAEQTKNRFVDIINIENPDLIQIWGTEYPHSYAMISAADEVGMLNKTIIYIQGLVSVYALHFCLGVPSKFLSLKVGGYCTIDDSRNAFVSQGAYEIRTIKKAQNIIGRTLWDKACVSRINLDAHYYYCGEILREEIYKNQNTWTYSDCIKHSIFVSQASYPVKGFHILLGAMQDIVGRFPDTHVFVGGNNPMKTDSNGNISPYGQYLRELIDEFGLTDNITFLGLLDTPRMIKQYKNANVFVSASTIENSSNSVYEAAVIGCPIISSFVGGIKDVVGESRRCYYYQSDAPYMLAHYIMIIFSEDFEEDPDMHIIRTGAPEENAEYMMSIYNNVSHNTKNDL